MAMNLTNLATLKAAAELERVCSTNCRESKSEKRSYNTFFFITSENTFIVDALIKFFTLFHLRLYDTFLGATTISITTLSITTLRITKMNFMNTDERLKLNLQF
jgi:hypothetical protein